MVTMRRDVAVTKNVGVASDGMTAYDRFLLKKNERRGEPVVSDRVKESDRKPQKAAAKSYAPSRADFEATATDYEKQVFPDTESAYEKYLLERLNNKTRGERVMTSEEFYASMLEKPVKKRAAAVVSETPKRAKREKEKKEIRPGKLTKAGKIILSVYVLLVLATAFILVAVNVFSAPVLADAEENIATGERTIRPMTTETLEKEEESWFDSLCDAVKK